MSPDPKLDLVLERVVDLTPEQVWAGWTRPELLVRWFTPAPWTTVSCEIDLRPGGEFRTVMRSPDGKDFPNLGCYLEVVPGRRLIWTDALAGGFRPSPADPHLPFRFTVALLLEPAGTGTRYTAIAMHADEESRAKHEAMGFHLGWGKALDQLVGLMKQPRS
jgi:uncharacterized protein YndB with AHSA1/START domain